jgi:hypothetical protein
VIAKRETCNKDVSVCVRVVVGNERHFGRGPGNEKMREEDPVLHDTLFTCTLKRASTRLPNGNNIHERAVT